MSTFNTAYDKLRNILALLKCLSELLDYPSAPTELHLSIDAVMGMSIILENMNKEGWEALELFDEAWQAKEKENSNA